MNNRLYGNLIFELSVEGRKGYSFIQISLPTTSVLTTVSIRWGLAR